jgi:cytochrome c oxidase cbb3-type subunit 3
MGVIRQILPTWNPGKFPVIAVDPFFYSPCPRWLSAAFCVAALIFAGCDVTRGTAAPNSAPPPMVTPVGPIPGPGVATHKENPYATDRNGMGEGRQLFNRMNCAGCHGDHGGGGMGPSLRDVVWLYGSSDAQVFSSIAEGRAHGMPAWGTKLNDDQIWKIVAYIKSFRTRYEIGAPS